MDFKEITTDILSSLMLSFSKMKVESEQARLIEVVYSGEFDEYLAMNNYDEELEEVLNCVQNGSPIKWTNEDGEMFIIREVA